MPDLADYSCTKCSFTSFCYEEKVNVSAVKFQNAAVKKHLYLEKKELLTLPRNKFQSFYAVKKGALKTYQINKDCKESIRGFFFEGEVFGYDAIYTNCYTYSIAALTDTVVCEIPYENLLDLIDKNTALQKKILYLISQQLNVGNYLISASAEQRVAGFLIDLLKRLESCVAQYQYALPLTRQDMGNYLGLTTETVSRLLSRFQKNNLIKIDNKKICILSIDKLNEIAGLIS